MPTYLLHGFRWPRPLIRIHIVMQNLDSAAPEWLIAPPTTATLLRNFHKLYPDLMSHIPSLRFIEQYDPHDIDVSSASQPFAYVADLVEEVRLGVEVDEVRGRGLGSEQWSAVLELRDRLAPGEKVGWFVVVCGDEERGFPEDGFVSEPESEEEEVRRVGTAVSIPDRQRRSLASRRSRENGFETKTSSPTASTSQYSQTESRGGGSGLKKLLSLTRRKSRARLRELDNTRSNSDFKSFNDRRSLSGSRRIRDDSASINTTTTGISDSAPYLDAPPPLPPLPSMAGVG